MNATPIADLLPAAAPTAQGTPGDKGAVADLLLGQLDAAAVDPRGAATFAALLQDAALASSEIATDERSRAVDPDAGAEPVAQAPSPLDTLLFLANLPGAQAVAALPANEAGPQEPDVQDDEGDIPLLTAVVTPLPTADGVASEPPAPTASARSRLALAGVALHDAMPRPAPVAAAEIETASILQPREPAAVAASNANAPAAEALAASTSNLAQVAAAPEAAPFAVHVQHASAGLRSDAVVQLHAPVSHPAWRDEAAERIASLVTRGVERAELRLSPAELGPVEVRIEVRGSEATLAIVAAQPTTRDALEQALPALRDLLSQQGLSLGEATVRDGRTDGRPSQERGGEAGRRLDDRGPSPRDEQAAAVRRGVRLIDTFA